MKGQIVTKRSFRCPTPDCTHLFAVEHLFAEEHSGSFGPWYCDECGKSWKFEIRQPDEIDIQPYSDTWTKGYALLELSPQKESVFIVVEHRRLNQPTVDEEVNDSAQFFFEEHSCPPNWLRHITKIQIGDDDDPHGLIKFVRFLHDDENPRQEGLYDVRAKTCPSK